MHIGKWFHHLFNPHCVECLHEQQCKNCEVLRQLLEVEKRENKQLLDRLLKEPEKIESVEISDYNPVRTTTASLKERRRLLEQEAIKRAQVEKDRRDDLSKSTNELEIELLGEKNAS